MTATPQFDYLSRQRHILLDMHVPDWDEGFLAAYDPLAQADRSARAGADAVMVYANSMLGLAYWPSSEGRMHPALQGRDVLGETVERLHEHGIAVCGYYSVNFNDIAASEAGQRMELVHAFGQYGPESRFGLCCPNSNSFLDFARNEVAELAQRYPFDAFFLDMMFWPGVCVCPHCRDRYRAETGDEIPNVVDWERPEWPRFAAARQRWLAEQYDLLASAVREHQSIPVFDNNSIMVSGWRGGLGIPLLAANDLLGGDVQAGPDELLTFGLLMSRLSRGPWQYMHSASGYLSGAAQSIGVDEQLEHALLATALDGQFMTIDAVMSDGSVHDATYDRFADVFAAMKPYEPYLGGTPTADVAIYYSFEADVDLHDNGTPLPELVNRRAFLQFLPHGSAAAGAIGALQRAHLPSGVITSADLHALDSFRVIVLPNVQRMTDEEVEAFRNYVSRGGNLYASGSTSLLAAEGRPIGDFALADLFGCSAEGAEPAIVSYIQPIRADLEAAIAPAAMVPHGATRPLPPGAVTGLTAVSIAAEPEGTVLATLTRPFGAGRGTREDRQWSSILTSPPWNDTGRAAIVENAFGDGRVIYSACDIEAGGRGAGASEELFVALIRDLLGGPAHCEADAPPNVWVLPYVEHAHGRIRVNLLNRQPGGPYLPVPELILQLTPPEGMSFTSAETLPDRAPLSMTIGPDGHASVEVKDLARFAMIGVGFAPERNPT